jgi:MFS family permease
MMESSGRRSIWWVVATIASGFVLPSGIAALFALFTYYPIGSGLPPFNFLSGTGAMLGIIAGAVLAVVGAGLCSLLFWNWRWFVLSILLVAAMSFGFVPGLWAHQYLKLVGYDRLGHRSVALISAIREFERERDGPPLTLRELVPDFLPAIPKTRMAAYPEYEYAPEPGPCPNDNKWHVKVDAGEVLQWDFYFFCPMQNYTEKGWGGYNEVRGDWAYLHE